MDWRKIYNWEIDLGNKKIQQFPLDLSMEKIVLKYGRVHMLSLVPQREGWQRIDIVIPKGTLPIYKREITKSTIPGNNSLRFKIGWKAGRVNIIMLIDARTGVIESKMIL